MKEKITTYDRVTGGSFIYRTVDMGREFIVVPEGRDWYRGFVDRGTHYIDIATGQPTEKTDMPVVVAGNQIQNIPAGTTAGVNTERQEGTIDDGVLDMPGHDHPQTFYVVLQHPHHHIWHGEVEYDPG